jgi:hypothetical protein
MARDGLLGRALDYAEDRLGWKLVEGSQLGALEEAQEKLGFFVEEANELAYGVMDYLGGRPHEMKPERRKRLAQRSRRALREDPLARAEAMLLSNFAFGRGVSKPQCASKKVQAVVDEAWEDPVNVRKLTGFEAQRHRSDELKTQANLYPVAFVKNGRVRVGFLDADLVQDVVCDPDDDELPLYYVVADRKLRWNFETHQYEDVPQNTGGMPRIVYWPHWRHVEGAAREAAENGEQPPPGPKAADLGEGTVEHIRINRIGRTQFGTPPWAASLRFFSAMNQLTEAHVAMAQAKSAWIAKRTVRGGPKAVVEAANSILTQTGEIAASSFSGPAAGTPRSLAAPVAPGSVWTENDASKLEALNLSSGAGEAATTAQIVRAPIAAAAGFGQHYLGDASNANLATATSLELPALMNVQAWQETFEGIFRWFVDYVIQEAARSGKLGGLAGVSTEEDATPVERMALSELRLSEDEERSELERRTSEDLSYTFEMPYPGRRNLPDVLSTVTSVAQAYDPAGVNVPLRRALLYFFARDGLGADDPARWVDEILPEEAQYLPGSPADPVMQAMNQPPPEEGGGGPTGPSGGATPTDEKSKHGERTGNPRKAEKGMAEAMIVDPDIRDLVRSTDAELDRMWREVVEDPAVKAAIAASAPSANGSGG